MNKSDDIKELANALCLAQTKMRNAKKSGYNPHFKSHFATLDDIIDAAKDALEEHHLSFMQFPSFLDGNVYVETIILHKSGQWISGRAGSPLVKQDPQAVGAVISYLRRYSLAAICGIAQEDDDGNAASNITVAPNKTPVDYFNKLMRVIVDRGISGETQSKWLEHFKVKQLKDLSEEQMSGIIKQVLQREIEQ